MDESLRTEWYRQAYTDAPVGMCFANRDLRFVDVNLSFCRMLGYSKKELLTKTILEITHPEDISRSAEKLQKLFSGKTKSFSVEKRYLTKDGGIVWGQTTVMVVGRDAKGKSMTTFAVVEDITSRVRLADSLKESESNYHSMIEMSPDSVAVHSGGKVIYVNETAVRLFGAKSDAELVGRPTLSFVHPDSLKVVTERITKMQATGEMAPLLEEKFLRLDGTPVDVEVVARSISYHGARAIMVVFHDISESKRIRDELRESEERYRNLAEAAHDMIFVLDRDGTVIYANSFAAAQFGKKPEEVVGKTREDLFGETAQTQDASINRVFSDGKPIYRETRMPFGEKLLWLGTWLTPLTDKTGKVKKILGVSRDISAQKETELKLLKLNRSLTESEETFRGLFDSVGEAIYIQDAEGKFLDVNPGAVKMYGYPREWFIGKSPLNVSAAEKNDMVKIKAAVDRAYAGEPQSFEFWGVRANGQAFPKEVRLYKGKYFGKDVVIALAIDITEKKKMETMREEFMMIAAHELRAPMAAIKWLLSMVIEGSYGIVSEKAKKALSEMAGSVDRLVSLIADMISISKMEAGELAFNPTEFPAEKLIGKVVEMFRSEATKKGLVIETDEINPVMIYADPDRTIQVMDNLVDNAIKFTKEGKVVVSVKVEAGMARISVVDTGMGIGKDFQEKLFTKFAQTGNKETERPSGTGLGLFISRELARKMGGDVVLEKSEVGRGSEFVLTLPLKK